MGARLLRRTVLDAVAHKCGDVLSRAELQIVVDIHNLVWTPSRHSPPPIRLRMPEIESRSRSELFRNANNQEGPKPDFEPERKEIISAMDKPYLDIVPDCAAR